MGVAGRTHCAVNQATGTIKNTFQTLKLLFSSFGGEEEACQCDISLSFVPTINISFGVPGAWGKKKANPKKDGFVCHLKTTRCFFPFSFPLDGVP